MALLLGTGRRRGVVIAGAAALAVNLPWFGYTRHHHLHNWVANQDTLSTAHLRAVLPWTDDIVAGMVRRWPGGGGLGLVLVVLAGAAAVLAGLALRATTPDPDRPDPDRPDPDRPDPDRPEPDQPGADQPEPVAYAPPQPREAPDRLSPTAQARHGL